MDAVGFSESAPPLYYALAWVWTQVTGTGEFGLRSLSALAGVATVPVAYLLGAELRGRRAGLMAAALVAVNPMLLWYSQEARAYALLVLLCAALAALLRPRPARAAAAATSSSGASSRAWPSPPTTSPSSRSPPRRSGCCAAAAARALPGLGIVAAFGLAAGAAGAPPDVARPRRMDRQLHASATGSGKRRRPSSPARPATSSPAPSGPALALVPLAPGARRAAPCSLSRGDREERRAAAIPLAVGAGRDRRSRSLLALALAEQGLRPRPQRDAGPGAAAGRGRDRRHPAGGAPRSAPALGAALLAYSLGFCVWASFSPSLQRPDWDAVAAELGEPAGAAGDRHLDPRRGLAALLPLDRRHPGARRPKATTGWSTKSTSSPTARCRRRRRRLLGPGFRETAREDAGRLFIRRFELPGPGLAPLRLRELRERRPQLPHHRRPARRRSGPG